MLSLLFPFTRSHIRALLYIALYPPHETKQTVDTSFSPSKIGKQQQRLLTITPTTAASACSVLIYFAITNHPDGVACALPSYDQSNVDNENDDYDSLIAKESRCISMAKNCWSMIEKGFVHRAVITSPTKRGARQRRSISWRVGATLGFGAIPRTGRPTRAMPVPAPPPLAPGGRNEA